MNPFTALVNALGSILSFFYDIIPNYGIAIIFLTLMVSFLLFPLTLKQTRSMKAMQEIQPEIKRLQKEYKDNKEEMQKQMMALYQERGVNPAAGCLPLLLQMPIWFALFQVLRVAPDPANPGQLTGTAIDESSALGQALLNDNADFLGMHLLQTPGQAFSSFGLPEALPYIILVLIVIGAGYYQTAPDHEARRRLRPGAEPAGRHANGHEGHAGALRCVLLELPDRARPLLRHLEPVPHRSAGHDLRPGRPARRRQGAADRRFPGDRSDRRSGERSRAGTGARP